jgi:S1-C subfamily serine protease
MSPQIAAQTDGSSQAPVVSTFVRYERQHLCVMRVGPLGMKIYPTDATFDGTTKKAAVVHDMAAGSSAFVAGFRAHDIIQKVQSKDASTFDLCMNALATTPERPMMVEVLRKEESVVHSIPPPVLPTTACATTGDQGPTPMQLVSAFVSQG